MKFTVTAPVAELGVKVLYCVIRGVDNTSESETEKAFFSAKLKELAQTYTELDYHSDAYLEGYHVLHDRAGVKRRKNIPSAENLIRVLRRHGTLPDINPIVNLYNVISMERRLCIAAHDLDQVEGGLTVKHPDGTERYIPMGQTEPVPLDAHEYYYCDDANDVLCRLELHQCSKTVVTPETKNLLLILEGHDATPDAVLEDAARELVNEIVQHHGGIGMIYHAEVEGA